LSQIYSIKNLLNIKDKNITFTEKGISMENFKGVYSKIIHAKLSYSPNQCPHCHGKDIIKWGSKTSNIRLLKILEYNSILRLQKQRFRCKDCGKTFSAETDIVDKNCCISNDVKLAITLKLQKNISEKDIASDFNVSPNTVNRIINSFFKEHLPNKNYLPQALCFDEFKATNDCEGAMAFIFCNADNGNITDILPNRRLSYLKEYFSSFSLEARKKVKHIVIDIYKPYMTLINDLFPNAKISLDRFHLVQLINRSFNKTRIKIMNQCKNKDDRYYNKLKKFWSLLLKNCLDLKTERINRGRMFDYALLSEEEIVDIILSKNSELKIAYEIYQELLIAIQDRKFNNFKAIIEKYYSVSNEIMKTSLKTFKKHLEYIENSLTYDYNNGLIEGINRKIKTIKRTAYGYKSFYHFRAKILISNNLLATK
jgi:transposase